MYIVEISSFGEDCAVGSATQAGGGHRVSACFCPDWPAGALCATLAQTQYFAAAFLCGAAQAVRRVGACKRKRREERKLADASTGKLAPLSDACVGALLHFRSFTRSSAASKALVAQ